MNDEIAAAIRSLPQRVDARPQLLRIGRFCNTEFLIESGDAGFHLLVERGRLVQVLSGPLRMRAWTFALRATPQAWRRFWSPVPEAGFHDIFAMARYGHLRIEGDIGPLLADLRFVKEVLALPRGTLAAEPRA